MLKRTGTQYGTSRAPVNLEDEIETEDMGYVDILSIDPDELAILRQRAKILKILNSIDEGPIDVW